MIKPVPTCSMFSFGSRVYGTYTNNSDFDIIVVDENFTDEEDGKEATIDKNNFHYYRADTFQRMLDEHHAGAVECFHVGEEHRHDCQLLNLSFNLNLSKLRKSFSSTASNSWVKAKKKMDPRLSDTYNLYVGQKSAWHALRILMFAIQLAKHGKIIDFSAANKLHPVIMSINTFDEIDSKFRTLYNCLRSELRILAPL